MDIKTKEVYSEVYSILNIMEEEYVNKIPKKLYDLIKSNRLETYNPVYDADKSLIEQNVKRETLAMLALLELNYWIETKEEKDEFMAMLQQNSLKKENKTREMYSSDNIFKKINEAREKEKIKEEDIEKAEETTIDVAKEEKGFFKRIFKK